MPHRGEQRGKDRAADLDLLEEDARRGLPGEVAFHHAERGVLRMIAQRPDHLRSQMPGHLRRLNASV